MSQTPLQRINRILAFYYKRGVSNKRAEKVYYKILSKKFNFKNNFVYLDKSDKI